MIAHYASALSSPGDAARGRIVFERECMACHRLGERGHQVGPNLALVRNRTPEALVAAILDPNRDVQPSYVNYVVTDTDGRTATGMITAETANSITLRSAGGIEETILRTELRDISSSALSLMPEGLEAALPAQAMADLLAYISGN